MYSKGTEGISHNAFTGSVSAWIHTWLHSWFLEFHTLSAMPAAMF